MAAPDRGGGCGQRNHQIRASICAGPPTWCRMARVAVRWWRLIRPAVRHQPFSPCRPPHTSQQRRQMVAPVPNLSIGSRGWNGPVWSPDGTRIAAIYEGTLAVVPVSHARAQARHGMTSRNRLCPSWSGDRQITLSVHDWTHMNIETGETKTVPLDPISRHVPKTTWCHVSAWWMGCQNRPRPNGYCGRRQSHHGD